jgi:hypothetical protein
MTIRLILILLVFFSYSAAVSAQTTTTTNTNPQTGVRITTNVKPIASLSDQVKDLEQKVKMAKTQPELIDNGTLAKYEAALAQRRKQLEEENAVGSVPTPAPAN